MKYNIIKMQDSSYFQLKYFDLSTKKTDRRLFLKRKIIHVRDRSQTIPHFNITFLKSTKILQNDVFL